MSELIELLSDLAMLDSTQVDMDQSPTNLISKIKNQLDAFHTELTTSINLAAASLYNDEYFPASISRLIPSTVGMTKLILDYHQNTAHLDEIRSLSQSMESDFDLLHAPFLQANLGLGVPALSKSSEPRSEATDADRMQADLDGIESRVGSEFNGDHAATNTLNQDLLTQLITTTLERPATSSASSSTSPGLSTVPLNIRGNITQTKRVFPGAPGKTSGANVASDGTTSVNFIGSSNSDLAVSGNATQMKRALSEASTINAAGGAQKKAKGDMDPVGFPSRDSSQSWEPRTLS